MTDFLDYIYITIEMERGNNKKKWGTFSFLSCNFIVFCLTQWVLCYCDQVLHTYTPILELPSVASGILRKIVKNMFSGVFFLFIIVLVNLVIGEESQVIFLLGQIGNTLSILQMKIAPHIHIDIHPVWSL